MSLKQGCNQSNCLVSPGFIATGKYEYHQHNSLSHTVEAYLNQNVMVQSLNLEELL